MFLSNAQGVRTFQLIPHPLSPNSAINEISLYIINDCLNIQVMRIKETNTKDEMSWYLDKFSLLVLYKMYGEQ